MGYFVIAKRHRCDHDMYLYTYEAHSLKEGIVAHIIDIGYLDDDIPGDIPEKDMPRFVRNFIKNNYTDEEDALEQLLERSEGIAEYKFLG